jgi:hypothetical protein
MVVPFASTHPETEDGMAFTWFAGTVVEALAAGVLEGLIVRES